MPIFLIVYNSIQSDAVVVAAIVSVHSQLKKRNETRKNSFQLLLCFITALHRIDRLVSLAHRTVAF